MFLGDLFEEIFFCDSLLLSSKSQLSESVRLAMNENTRVTFKGSNSLIKYRLKNLYNESEKYLHELLDLEKSKKIFFTPQSHLKKNASVFNQRDF